MPNTDITGLTKKRSLTLVKKKNRWKRMRISESKIHLGFLMEYPYLRKLEIRDCHVDTKGKEFHIN